MADVGGGAQYIINKIINGLRTKTFLQQRQR